MEAIHRKQFARFFIYEAADRQGRPVFILLGFPIYLVGACKRKPQLLKEYAEAAAKKKNLAFVRLLDRRVLQGQPCEIDGNRLIVTGEETMANDKELAFTQDELSAIKMVIDGSGCDDEVLRAAYEAVWRQINAQANECMATYIDGISLQDIFDLDIDAGVELLKAILRAFRGGRGASPVDLSPVGGLKNAFRLRPARSKIPSDFYIIDQSVTGMFERRTRVGL